MASSLRLLSHSITPMLAKRALHTSSSAYTISKFAMPAMSPTMTEGGLAAWKVKEGDSFKAGDVLLEIETDKATMDVEAQDDGIMGKIFVNDGAKAVPVGKVIAMLAEEGDDISSIEAPAEEEASTSEPSTKPVESSSSSSSSSGPPSEPKSTQTQETSKSEPKHAPKTSKPLMPSVMRLLAEFEVSDKDAESIKGTGVRGMLTKGDVLVYLGKAQSPTGTFKVVNQGISAQSGGSSPALGSGKDAATFKKSEPPTQPLTADSLRSMILGGLASSSHSSRSKEMAAAISPSSSTTRKSAFDELLDDYQFKSATPIPSTSKPSKDPFKGLL